MDALDRDLLELCHTPRDAATVGFLYSGGRPATFDVEARLRALGAQGLLREEGGRWSITDAGRDALRELHWEFLVEEILELTRLGRFAVGVIRRGTIFAHDWFVVGERLGRVRAVEFVSRRGRNDLVGLGVDIELRSGDVLRRHDPVAGAQGE